MSRLHITLIQSIDMDCFLQRPSRLVALLFGMLFWVAGAWAQSPPPIALDTTRSVVAPGERFVLLVEVGTESVQVADFFGVSLKLQYDASVFRPARASAGPFMQRNLLPGTSVLQFDTTLQDAPGATPFGITRVRPNQGVDGTGIAAYVEVDVREDASEGDYTLSINDVEAIDSEGHSLTLGLPSSPLVITVEKKENERRSTITEGDPPPITYDSLDITLDFTAVDTLLDVVVATSEEPPADPPPSSQFTISGTMVWNISVTAAAGTGDTASFAVDLCFPLSSLNEDTDVQSLVVLKRDDASSPWQELQTEIRGQDVCAVGVSDFSTFVIAETVEGAPSAIEELQELPERLVLEQNFPNPFSRATTIRYGLPEAGNVQIQIYNVLGQIVRRVTSSTHPAGWHTATFPAGELPSGIYFYRIATENHVETQRMLIVR